MKTGSMKKLDSYSQSTTSTLRKIFQLQKLFRDIAGDEINSKLNHITPLNDLKDDITLSIQANI